jgi:hypothetical protein
VRPIVLMGGLAVPLRSIARLVWRVHPKQRTRRSGTGASAVGHNRPSTKLVRSPGRLVASTSGARPNGRATLRPWASGPGRERAGAGGAEAAKWAQKEKISLGSA